MKRWEYKQVHENDKRTLADELAAAGRQGWEAYAVTQYGDVGTYTVWMKRELTKPKHPNVVR